MRLTSIIPRSLKGIPQIWSLGFMTLFLFLMYLMMAWFFFPLESIWSPDEGAKLLQMKALRKENGKLLLTIPITDKDLDPSKQFALSENPKDLLSLSKMNELQFERLPFFPLLSKPFYNWIGLKGIYFLPALAGAFIGFLTLLLIEPKDRRFTIWFLISLASPIWIYSMIFWEHTLALTLSLSASLLLLINYRCNQHRYLKFSIYTFSALLFTLSIYLRFENLIFAISFICACIIIKNENRVWLLYSAFLIFLFIIPYGILQALLFEGNPVPLNMRFIFRPFDYLRSAGWGAIPDLLIGPGTDEALDPGGMGGLWAIVAILAVAHSFTYPHTKAIRLIRWISLGLYTLVAVWFLFIPSPYRAAHGLLFTTPWAILGITRMSDIWKINNWRARVVILTAIMGLITYIIAILVFRGSSPHGGMEWGARLAIFLYPLLAIIAAWDWIDLPAIDIILIISLFLLGLGFQLRGLATIRADRQINLEINQAISAIPEGAITTDLWWFLLNTAPIEPTKTIFTVKDLTELINWVNLVQANQLQSFALVTLDRSLAWRLRAFHPEFGLQVREIIRVGDVWLFRLILEP